MRTPLRLHFMHGSEIKPLEAEVIRSIDGGADMPVPLAGDNWGNDGTVYRVMSRTYTYERIDVAAGPGLVLPVITFYVLTDPWWEDPKGLRDA